MSSRKITVFDLLDSFGCTIINQSQGWIACPGEWHHTVPTAHRDCKLFDNGNGFYQIHCVHVSCAERVRLANYALARLAGVHLAWMRRGTDPAIKAIKDDEAKEVHAEIQQKYRWNYDDICAEGCVTEPVEEHYYQILGLFADDDVVWCGRDVYDSGSSGHASRFRTTREWLIETKCPGPFTCPSTFRPGSFMRMAANILTPKFLVVESDVLDRNEIGAIFKWLDRTLHISLRAIVDTGGKSLHGWFDYPQPHVLTGLKEWLPRLGCDPALFSPSQPCRLPGAKRGDRYQRLIFIR